MKDMNYLRRDWMTDDQYECYKMLADLFDGDHHLEKVKPCGVGIKMNTRHGFSTFDFAHITKAVIMAHARLIRFSVEPSGPGMIKLVLHKRTSAGRMWERHPGIDELIALAEQGKGRG